MNDTPASVADTSNADDPRLPLLRAVRFGVIALVVITVASLAIWGGMRGMPGVWGVIVGAGIGGGFVLFTALSVLFSARTTPTTTLAIVFGGWLIKLVLLLVVLFIIRDLEFYDPMALFITVVAALIATLGSEVWAVVTSRMTNVY